MQRQTTGRQAQPHPARESSTLSYDYHLLMMSHVISAAMLVALLALVAMNRREPLAPWLSSVFALLLLWTVAYVIEVASGSVATKIVWANVQFISAASIPLLWFYAMRRAAGSPRLPSWLTAFLWIICSVVITCAFTNPGHLFRGHPMLDRSGPIAFLDADYGLLYFVLWVPFAYGLLMVALVTLGHTALRGPQLARARCRLLIAATLLPMLVGVLFIVGALPWPNFNPAISSLSVSAGLCAVALVRYRLLDITPLARETVIEQLPDPLIVADARGLLCDFNPAASRVLPELSRSELGHPLETVLAGRSELTRALLAARELAARADAATPPSAAAGEASRQPSDDEHILALAVGKTGDSSVQPELRHFSLRVTPVVRRTGLRIGEAIVLHDVTQSRRLYAEARRAASTDELTGLLSRRRLLELGLQEVARARRHGRRLGVLLLDIDHFKLVNDQHGHAAGDAVLRALGACCRAELREFDLLGRYGGDEFCAVLPEVGLTSASAVAERLRAAVSVLIVWHEGAPIRPTVSIGVVAAQVEDDTTLDELMRSADEALYEAKQAGRDRVASAHQHCGAASGQAAHDRCWS